VRPEDAIGLVDDDAAEANGQPDDDQGGHGKEYAFHGEREGR
jgi:hypothetical protein